MFNSEDRRLLRRLQKDWTERLRTERGGKLQDLDLGVWLTGEGEGPLFFSVEPRRSGKAHEKKVKGI